jgi:transposase-like protein
LKIRSKWTFLYRAVDQEGQTVDFRLSVNRDVHASKAFFRNMLKTQGRPPVSITLDGYAASHRAVLELPEQNSRWKDTRQRASLLEQHGRAGPSRREVAHQVLCRAGRA